MGSTPTEVMAFPKISAIVRDNGTAEVIVAGNSRIVPAGKSLQELRTNALDVVVGEAKTLQRPVRVQIEDPEGHGELIVHPDHTIESLSYEAHSPRRRRAQAPKTTPESAAPSVILTETVPAPEPVVGPTVTENATEDPKSDPVAKQPATAWPPIPSDPEPVSSNLQPTTEETEVPQQAVGTDAKPLTRRSLKETSFLVSAPGS